MLEWLHANGMTLRLNGRTWEAGGKPLLLCAVEERVAADKVAYQFLVSANVSTAPEYEKYRLAHEGTLPALPFDRPFPAGQVSLRPGQFWIVPLVKQTRARWWRIWGSMDHRDIL